MIILPTAGNMLLKSARPSQCTCHPSFSVCNMVAYQTVVSTTVAVLSFYFYSVWLVHLVWSCYL